MADSFALTDNGVVLQQPAPVTHGVQITLQGGTSRGVSHATPGLAPGGDFQGAADMPVKAIEAIGKLVGGALAPYIEEQQRRAYFDGMSQVVQGKALQDIHREQPWYTRIFGPSATVQGAQALTAMTAISQAQSEAMAAMPELRKQHPDAMRQYMVEQAIRIGSTGDPTVDGLVQQKLSEQWPTLLDTHMKQHYAWQQEDMGNKFVNMQVANGSLLQQTMNAQMNFSDPKQMQVEFDKFKAGLMRPAGMDDGHYGKYMTLAAQTQLQNGNFAAYDAMKRDPDVWQAIPPEARMALEKSEELWSARAQQHSPALVDIMTDRGKFALAVTQGAFFGDEQAVHTAIDSFNARYKAQTGSDLDIIDNKERAHLIQQALIAQEKMAHAYAMGQQGLLNDEAQQANILNAYNLGDPAVLAPGVSEVNARNEMEKVRLSIEADPERLDMNGITKLAQVSGESKLRIPSLESQLRADVQALFSTGGDITPRQQQSLRWMQSLLSVRGGGVRALANYVGADDAAKVIAFLKSGADWSNEASVTAARQLIKEGWGAHTDAEDIKAAQRYVKAEAHKWFSEGALEPYDLNDASRGWIAQNLAPWVARYRKAQPGLSAEEAAKLAFAKQYGDPQQVDFVDGTIIPRNGFLPGAQSLYAGVQQLAQFPVSQSSKLYQNAVRDVLRDTLTANVRASVDARNKVGVDSIGSPHKPDMRRFRLGDYRAVGGEQLSGGALMVFYYDEARDAPPVMVRVTPEQVLEQMKHNMAHPDYRDGGKTRVRQRVYRQTLATPSNPNAVQVGE